MEKETTKEVSVGKQLVIHSKVEELFLPGIEVTLRVYRNEHFDQTLVIFNKYREMLNECPILRKGYGVELEVKVDKTYIEKDTKNDLYIIVMEGVVV